MKPPPHQRFWSSRDKPALSVMGTRLYIEAAEEVLEEILNVPTGAWAKMEEIREKYESEGSLSEEMYKAREREWHDNAGTGTCYDFALFGFGKLNMEQINFLRSSGVHEDDIWGGASRDRSLIRGMLARSGCLYADWAIRNLDEITRIYWG